MKKRIIIIAIICIAAVAGLIIWALSASSRSANTQSEVPTDEEQIRLIANNDPAAADHTLTASSVRIEKKDGNWYLAAITYYSATSGAYTTYPTILLRDSDGDFSIVVGFDNSTSDESLAAQNIPKAIRSAIVQPGKEIVEDISP